MMSKPLFLFLLCSLSSNHNTFVQFQPNLEYQGIGFRPLEEELMPIIQQMLMFYVHERLAPDHDIIRNWKDTGFKLLVRRRLKEKKRS